MGKKKAKGKKKKKGVRKKAAAPSAPEKPTTAEIHGMALSVGDLKRAQKGKGALVAVLPRQAVRIVKGFNPRTSLGELDTLAASIKTAGLINPVTVRPAKGKSGLFDLVAGERRLRALDMIGRKTVEVVIRPELEGDNLRSLALALAENVEEGRSNLNAIEIGRVLKGMAGENWSVSRIAKETGQHARKVRRCLTLTGAASDIQAKIESGDLSMVAGLELAKASPATLKKIKDKVPENASAPLIKKMIRAAAKAAGAKPGQHQQQAKGASRDAGLAAWKGSKEKRAMIEELSYHLINADDDDEGTVAFHEARGAAASLLWDRGDLGEPRAPSLDPSDAANKAEGKKALADFNALLEAAAAKHTPEE